MAYITLDDIPTFNKVDDAVNFLTALSDKFCPDKVRLYFIESEGFKFEYGSRKDTGRTLPEHVRHIAISGMCYTDKAFRTGWIERDGTLRSNNYTCHDDHIYSINLTGPIVERMGWIHVSRHECTAQFTPTKAQIREMERIDKPYNSNSVLRRWVPIKKEVPISEQLEPLYNPI